MREERKQMQGARTGSHSYSILQGKSKRCYFTDTETGPLERHHIYFGAGMRQISDKHGFWVWLKPEWHRGTQGVHGRDGHKIDLRLKQDCQRKFEEAHSREEFMAIVGRNYLPTAQEGAADEVCFAKQSGEQPDEPEGKPQMPADTGGFYLL